MRYSSHYPFCDACPVKARNNMGILRRHLQLESFFGEEEVLWDYVSEKGYRQLIQDWKRVFDYRLNSNIVVRGEKAIYEIEKRLPFSGFIFSCPNYENLPYSENAESGGMTFAYRVDRFLEIKREKYNELEFIVTDVDVRFMCAFNHEAPHMVPEVFCQA